MVHRPRPRLVEIVRVLSARERRWLRRRLMHESLFDPRAGLVAIFAATSGLAAAILPFAQGVPLARNATVHAALLGLALGLGCVTVAWWTRLALASLMQHLLVLRRCGCCGHPEQDRGPALATEAPFACRTWRCVECGAEWIGTGTFLDAETRRDAA